MTWQGLFPRPCAPAPGGFFVGWGASPEHVAPRAALEVGGITMDLSESGAFGGGGGGEAAATVVRNKKHFWSILESLLAIKARSYQKPWTIP